MDYESLCMCDKILRTLENALKNDPYIEDFTIIPSGDNATNKNPVLHEEHHLGLESWCIKYLYQYVCNHLMHVRKSLSQRKSSHSVNSDLNCYLMGALFINPDVTTFWNMRRELVQRGVFSFDDEIRFSKLVLTRKNKSNDAFAYRRWLIDQRISKLCQSIDQLTARSILQDELQICTITVESTPNNYHAWTHRQWCMSRLAHYCPSLINSELEFMERRIQEHVSENTGYHYRQFLIDGLKSWQNVNFITDYYERVMKLLYNKDSDCLCDVLTSFLGPHPEDKCVSRYINHYIALLFELLVLIESVDKMYIGHESLWLHRRFVVFRILQLSFEYLDDSFDVNPKIETILDSQTCITNNNIIKIVCSEETSGEKKSKIFKSKSGKFEKTNMYKILCESEKSFINQNLCGNDVQKNLAKRHQAWLKTVIGFDIS